jgi:site-specific recombinase XerC
MPKRYARIMAKKSKTRRNVEKGTIQISVWLVEKDIKTLRAIGKRPGVEREWSWLARKAIREFIERDEQQGIAATPTQPS